MLYRTPRIIGLGVLFLQGLSLGYGEALKSLDCKTLIRKHPLPYTDGRVAFFCERAFQACLLDKAVELEKQDLETETDPTLKARVSSKLQALLDGNRDERDHYLEACQMLFNFFENPDNATRIFREGL